MATLKGPGAPKSYDGSGLRVGIVHARWNNKIIDALLSGAKKSLADAGVKKENIVIQSVPGSYELPFAVQRIDLPSLTKEPATKGSTAPFDAIIAIGVLIKGETMHFEYIADATTQGLMRVQLDSGVPVIFGLLTVLDEEQGLARAGIAGVGGNVGHNHGSDWGSAAVELGVKRKGWAEGKMID
ncbi:6,7-dimethyl-8-ribityllumazine synthase-like protein [Lophium mytilinum]|uniref:6,7-dimethyl-8-ribityllumazine synthase n=1 Tax=Lophium mytilinum TaxID=390894 RepID=A0A6A6R5J5_9PEZI|nr:6,7-dimethyl-8-ribityllumazine synthase-like protein [Lophium mytilinum]